MWCAVQYANFSIFSNCQLGNGNVSRRTPSMDSNKPDASYTLLGHYELPKSLVSLGRFNIMLILRVIPHVYAREICLTRLPVKGHQVCRFCQLGSGAVSGCLANQDHCCNQGGRQCQGQF